MLSLFEEMFFFQYHLKLDMFQAMKMPVWWRRWFVDRFVYQKDKENEAIEKAQKKAKSRAKTH